eukprot:4734515-Prymnesium_polylepis.1
MSATPSRCSIWERPGCRVKHCSHSPAARVVQGVAAPDLIVDPPVVMTRCPFSKMSLQVALVHD